MKTKSLPTPEALRRQIAMNVAAVERMSHASDDDGKFIHDRVVAANASLFTEGYFSEPLTGYAVGWRDPNNIEQTLEFFAPQCPVPRRFEYATLANAEEFLSDSTDDDLRAIRGDFKSVEYTEGKVNAKTENRGLKICVDLDQVADKQNWRENYTQKILRRLRRNSLRRAVALLSAAAVNTAKTWDATAGKNPDGDVRTELKTAATVSGIRPNRVGYGDTAWDLRVSSHEAQNNAQGYAAAGRTPQSVGSYLNVDQVLVSRERYQSAAATKAEIVNNLVLMFFANSGMDAEDPSNIKRFVSPCEAVGEMPGGGYVRVFERQISAKLYEIVVEHYEKISITSTLAIRKFTVS